MIRVLGKEHYLTIGQTSPEGATLVESDAQHAVVRYKDETYKLTLSDRVGGAFQAANQTSLSIAPDEIGQYRMQGSINGHMVDFLVDTGASLVAISERTAKQMGIPLRRFAGARAGGHGARTSRIRIWSTSTRSRSAASRRTTFERP